MTPAGVAPSAMARLPAMSAAAPSVETFAAAMAGARQAPRLVHAAARAPATLGSRDATLGALARQLDEIARHRIEAQALSSDLAGAWATGMDTSTLAVKMHRQARAVASYNMSIMWGAKLVGVTASALRQLTAAT
jgi:hypothetical protein